MPCSSNLFHRTATQAFSYKGKSLFQNDSNDFLSEKILNPNIIRHHFFKFRSIYGILQVRKGLGILLAFISESRLNYEAKNPISYEAQNPICYEAFKTNLFLKYEATTPSQSLKLNNILNDTPLEKRKLSVLKDLEDIVNSQVLQKKKIPLDLTFDYSRICYSIQGSKTTEDSSNNQYSIIDPADFFSLDKTIKEDTVQLLDSPIVLDVQANTEKTNSKQRPSAAKDFKGLIAYGFGQIVEKYINLESFSNYAESMISFKWNLDASETQIFKKKFLSYVQTHIQGKTGTNGKGKFKVSSSKDIERCFHAGANDDDQTKQVKELTLIMIDYFFSSKYYYEWLYCIYDSKIFENKEFFKNNKKEILQAFLHPNRPCKFSY